MTEINIKAHCIKCDTIRQINKELIAKWKAEYNTSLDYFFSFGKCINDKRHHIVFNNSGDLNSIIKMVDEEIVIDHEDEDFFKEIADKYSTTIMLDMRKALVNGINKTI